MRMIRLTALALMIVLNATASDRGALSLIDTAPVSKVKSGSIIVVQVATKNESSQVISYHNTNLCDYSVTVRTVRGALAPETPFKKRLDCSGGQLRITGRNILITLKPGESDSEDVRVSELYEMSTPG